MKLALIPPKGWESFALHSNFHLALAQVSTPRYKRLYRGMADYVVLDNGAAEGPPVSDTTLLDVADDLQVQEIVVPDVIADREATIERAKIFFADLRESGRHVAQYGFMGVVQGTTLAQLWQCVNEFSDIPFIGALGIPRHLISLIGLKTVRITLAERIIEAYPNRFHIHLLGTNPKAPREVWYAERGLPGKIRSVDTSMPFNYAIAGVLLKGTLSAINRPDTYLTRTQTMNTSILEQNIATMKKWARGE